MLLAGLAQLAEHQFCTLVVVGSSPTSGSIFYKYIGVMTKYVLAFLIFLLSLPSISIGQTSMIEDRVWKSTKGEGIVYQMFRSHEDMSFAHTIRISNGKCKSMASFVKWDGNKMFFRGGTMWTVKLHPGAEKMDIYFPNRPSPVTFKRARVGLNPQQFCTKFNV